jgi:hypothetical protein
VVLKFQKQSRELCRGDLLAGASVGRLPHCLHRQFLVASVASPRTVPEEVSLEQSLYCWYIKFKLIISVTASCNGPLKEYTKSLLRNYVLMPLAH